MPDFSTIISSDVVIVWLFTQYIIFEDSISGERRMRNLLATLLIACLFFASSPAEAGKRSLINKFLEAVEDVVKEKKRVGKNSGDEDGISFDGLRDEGVKKAIEQKRDEDKKEGADTRKLTPEQGQGIRERLPENPSRRNRQIDARKFTPEDVRKFTLEDVRKFTPEQEQKRKDISKHLDNK